MMKQFKHTDLKSNIFKEFLHQNTVDVHEMQHKNPHKFWKNETDANEM